MSRRSSQDRYGTVAVGLHWTSAALVLAQLAMGLTMTRINGGDNDTMYRAHVGIGMLIALLTIGRVAWRVIEPSPRTPPMPSWRRVAYIANHGAFYVVLAALAGTGIATLVASDLTPLPWTVDAAAIEDGRARDNHFVMALIFSALFVMHVAGVVTYQRTKGDVFSRMGITGLASGDAAAMPTTASGDQDIETPDP